MATDQASSKDHEDLLQEVVGSAQRQGTFVIETEEPHPDMEFTVTPPDTPTVNELQRNMPSGLLEGVDLPDNIDDPDEFSVEDIDLSGLSVQDMTFSQESTEVWLDIISEHFEHDYYSPMEVRQIFDSLDHEYFVSAGSFLIELRQGVGPVEGFRKES